MRSVIRTACDSLDSVDIQTDGAGYWRGPLVKVRVQISNQVVDDAFLSATHQTIVHPDRHLCEFFFVSFKVDASVGGVSNQPKTKQEVVENAVPDPGNLSQSIYAVVQFAHFIFCPRNYESFRLFKIL